MILDDIVKQKKKRIEQTSFLSESEYLKRIGTLDKPISFKKTMEKDGLAIIGEIKKASPTKGTIRKDFQVTKIAEQYNHTVDAISVLTEEDYFLGSPRDLIQTKMIVSVPILRKDFIIDERQIYESRVIGASSILLITSILKKEELRHFLAVTEALHMDALVEVHTEEEIDTAIYTGAKIIGINNRNLLDFSIDINTTLHLSKYIPKDIVIISESGFSQKEDIKRLKTTRVAGALIGESFMRENDISQKVKEFKEAYEHEN